jgi:hypothetical protein
VTSELISPARQEVVGCVLVRRDSEFGLSRDWDQAKLALTPSTGGGAIQVGLEQAKRLFPAESIATIDL